MTTFLDTNILIYLLKSDAPLHAWAVEQLNVRRQVGPAIIADVVYCEFGVGMPSQAAVDAAVAQLALERMASDDAVLFRAAAAFKRHCDEVGPRTRVLPDFLVGALAEAAGAPLMTNDARNFAPYFPRLELIRP